MKRRIAISTSSFASEDAAPLELLDSAGVEVVPNPYGRRLREDEIIEHLKEIDGLIAGLEPLNRRVLGSADRLKVIARVGIGMANVDVEAAHELGIKVSNTPEGPTEAVAEMTMTAMLALCRGLEPANAQMHRGEWHKTINVGLAGTKILLVGYGRIGRRVGELARVFGAEILVVDPYIESGSLKNDEILMSLDEGLAQAEIVSLHTSGADCVLGEAEIEKMRDGALLLNSARGELVNESALVGALESGKIRGAWLDAFWQEPYRGPLLQFDQVLLTPHASTYTRQCRRSMEETAVRNLLRDLGVEG